MRGKAPFRRGELLAAHNWTRSELAGLVRQSLADASELLRWQLGNEGWRLRPRGSRRPPARASGAEIYFSDLMRMHSVRLSSIPPRIPSSSGLASTKAGAHSKQEI
uniref:Uncharacterized protein n=1 Tax=Alexandrium catenella TaxID=2925 RepID=A0A7S1RHU3_ALECA|mmetsp:Transcript_58300/g.156002  ORF Transcript_58300/g.156002 Transcript_58300/m.156002 type:complete len:106 (+) Transcript_58300:120-437(+)